MPGKKNLSWIDQKLFIKFEPKYKTFFAFILGFFGAFFSGIILYQGLGVAASSLACFLVFFISLFSIKLLNVSTLKALLIIIFSVMTLSFCTNITQFAFTIVSQIFFLFVIYKRRVNAKKLLQRSLILLNSISTLDWIAWIGLSFLLFSLGYMTKDGFLAFDSAHPLYELSFGHSFSNSFFNAPDLSFAGKIARYNFLGSALTRYFSNVFFVSYLQALYFLVPCFLLLNCFVGINIFFKKFNLVKIPALLLFFTPIIFWGLNENEMILTRTLLISTSHWLGFVLLLIASYLFIKRQYSWFGIAAVTLLLVKVPFGMALIGAGFLYFLRKWQFKKIVVFLAVSIPVFLSVYGMFLSGAHEHNLWLLFPTMGYLGLVNSSYNFDITLGTLVRVIPFLFYTGLTIFVYFRGQKENKKPEILFLSSLALSGIVGSCLLFEVTEWNSFQFFYAGYFSHVLILMYFLKNSVFKQPRIYKKIILSIGVPFLVWSGLLTLEKPVLHLAYKFPGVITSYQEIKRNVSEKIGFLSLFLPRDYVVSPQFSSDLIKGYEWASHNIPDNAIVLYSPYYEKLKGRGGFIRSALSGKQLFFESQKFKGIAMQKEYPDRVSQSLLFYKNFVQMSADSKALLDLYYADDFGVTPGIPMSKMKDDPKYGTMMRLIYPLSLNKEWSWLNQPKMNDYLIRANLSQQKDELRNSWADQFLHRYKIRYIVLENKDMPSVYLKENASIVYANNSVSILKLEDFVSK